MRALTKFQKLAYKLILCAVLAATAVVATSDKANVLDASNTSTGSFFAGFAANPIGSGYWTVRTNGQVYNSAGVNHWGGMSDSALNKPVVAIAATPTGAGYWLVASDGGVFAFGDAQFYGSTGAIKINKPVVAIAATPTGAGYWLVASDGGVFAFGDAQFYGSLGSVPINKPIVSVAASSQQGYWLVASDGGVFAFGDAPFYGSMGGQQIAAPVVGIGSSGRGGYRLVASDGGVFAFGDAPFYGSTSNMNVGSAVGLAMREGSTEGYVVVLANGGQGVFGVGVSSYIPSNNPADQCSSQNIPDPGNAGSYSFTRQRPDGTPVRWDRCQQIRWAINQQHLVPGSEPVIAESFRKLQSATGLDFVYVGLTNETYDSQKSNPAVREQVNVIVDFAPPGDPRLCGGVGCGGFQYDGSGKIVGGYLVLQNNLAANWGTNSMGPIAVHELGHVVGLSHVTSSDQVMYPIVSSRTDYANGDRAGLWRVGVGSPRIG